MFFTSLTPRNDIGGSCFLLEMGDSRIVLDCGLHPKEIGLPAIPQIGGLDQDSVDAFFLSHAHFDHVGAVPVLLRQQPNAKILLTEGTRHVAGVMLHNSVHVMQCQRTEKGITEFPLFTHREVDRMMKRFHPSHFNKPIHVGSDGEVTCKLHPAGHVLGAAAASFTYEGKTVLYTGDVQFIDQAIVKKAELPTEGIDTLVIETTHGAKAAVPGYTRKGEAKRLAAHIKACHDRGGSVLIPVFALGKTQEMLVLIHQMKQAGEIPDMPLFIGGLSTKVTGVFDRLADSGHRHLKGFSILDEVDLTVASAQAGNALRYAPGCIFALSSGMLSEKTVSNGFAPEILNDPRNALLMVGYCDPDTPGGKILEQGNGGEVVLNADQEPTEINCEVERFDFTGHASREELLDYILKVDAKKTLLVHGDPVAKAWFYEELTKIMGAGRVFIPEPGIGMPL